MLKNVKIKIKWQTKECEKGCTNYKPTSGGNANLGGTFQESMKDSLTI